MNNKILKSGLKRIILIMVSCVGYAAAVAQNLPFSSYGLPVINSESLYQQSLLFHPEKQMVSIGQIPGIILDLRYASTNNFMHKKLYPENTKNSFLRKPVCLALQDI